MNKSSNVLRFKKEGKYKYAMWGVKEESWGDKLKLKESVWTHDFRYIYIVHYTISSTSAGYVW